MIAPYILLQIISTSFKFDRKSANKELVLPIEASFKSQTVISGSITIPAGTFAPGCTLHIDSSKAPSDVQKSDPLACDPQLDLASVAVELTISGGCQSKGFKKPVTIELNSMVTL